MKRVRMISAAVLVGAVMAAGISARYASQANAQTAAKAKSEAAVIVGGLSIARAIKDDKFNRSMASGMKSGTTVSLQVSMPDQAIIELDRTASMLTKFTDDKGTVLGKPGSGKGYKSWLSSFPRIADDAHSCAPSVRSEKLPAAGAAALIIEAALAFKCGQAPKTVKQEVAMTKGAAVKLGPIAAKIARVGKPGYGSMKMSVSFSSSQSFDSIRKLAFLDSAGKEIKSRRAGGGSSSFGSVSTYSADYELEKKVDKVTIQIDYWDKIENVTVPVKLNVGLGL